MTSSATRAEVLAVLEHSARYAKWQDVEAHLRTSSKGVHEADIAGVLGGERIFFGYASPDLDDIVERVRRHFGG